MVTFGDVGKVYGYYFANNERFYCGFFFMTKGAVHVLHAQAPVEVFSLDYRGGKYNYSQRDYGYSVSGILIVRDNGINIKTDSWVPGCQSAAGGFFEEGGLPYTKKMKIPGLGIAVVNKKTMIYDAAGSKIWRGYLVSGDAVAVIKRKNRYSYIRYVNPDMLIDEDDKKKVTTGWVHSADLVNPFPPASKQ